MIDQVAYWNGAPGERWVKEQAALDDMLRPFSEVALATAAVAPGEAVLDIGCGCGDTSLTLATLVGEEGRVLGLDVSEPMLGRAKARGATLPNLTFVLGDAASTPLDASTVDLLFSRFGVMFFPEPVQAFAHLRTALRPTGRLTFVCWRTVAENPWAALPFEAVARVLGRPEPAPPDAPGPFAFGDEARVRRVLAEAGFERVALRALEGTMPFHGSVAEAAAEITRLGPVARFLADRDEADVKRATAAIEEILPPYVTADGVRFPARVWIVTAARGA